MRHLTTAVLLGALALPVMAQGDTPRLYGALMGHAVLTDDQRPDLDDAGGVTGALGWTLSRAGSGQKLDLELGGFSSYIDHESNAVNDYFHGIGLDLRWRPLGDNPVSPYLIGGAGVTYEDTQFLDRSYPVVNLGLGLRVDTPFRNVRLRAESRAYGVFNDRIGAFNNPPTPDEDFFVDARIALGVEVGFSTVDAVTDLDGDGVVDPRDRCPATPATVKVDGQGCPLPVDSDGDGVPDERDACPDTARGVAVLSTGCPPPLPEPTPTPVPVNPDLDGDGVLNDDDGCPNTPPGMKVDPRGCVVKQVVVFDDVNFEFNSDRLTPDARNRLLNMADGLRGQPDLLLEIAGHTDSIGSEAANLKLSRQRADAVRRYLVEQGIPAHRLNAVGFGEAQPVATNMYEAGRAQNRRVEFRVIKP